MKAILIGFLLILGNQAWGQDVITNPAYAALPGNVYHNTPMNPGYYNSRTETAAAPNLDLFDNVLWNSVNKTEFRAHVYLTFSKKLIGNRFAPLKKARFKDALLFWDTKLNVIADGQVMLDTKTGRIFLYKQGTPARSLGVAYSIKPDYLNYGYKLDRMPILDEQNHQLRIQ